MELLISIVNMEKIIIQSMYKLHDVCHHVEHVYMYAKN